MSRLLHRLMLALVAIGALVLSSESNAQYFGTTGYGYNANPYQYDGGGYGYGYDLYHNRTLDPYGYGYAPYGGGYYDNYYNNGWNNYYGSYYTNRGNWTAWW